MLHRLVMLALAAFAGAVLLHAAGFAVAVPVHLALAGGALPLIAGAMAHFAPVLTRSPPAAARLRVLPWLLLLAGLLVTASFVVPRGAVALRDVAATLGLVAAAALAGWLVRLSRRSLGGVHPGLYWYLAALICLLFGLLAVLLMHAWPAQYLALRRLHLHLNTLGFIGITAMGTLQVLLPTAAGVPDPQAGQRLRGDLPWVLAGTLLIAAGAAWQGWLVWPGLLLWLWPLLRLARAWGALYRKAAQPWPPGAGVLAGALAGFGMVLVLGAGHGAGLLPATHASLAYLFAFLLPLVTGAAGYLLPLWRRPGPQTAWHGRVRQALARFGLLRLALFLAAGVLTAWSGAAWGWPLAAAGLLLFVLRLPALYR